MILLLRRVRYFSGMLCKLIVLIVMLGYIIPQLLGLISQYIDTKQEVNQVPGKHIMKVIARDESSYLDEFIYKFTEAYNGNKR